MLNEFKKKVVLITGGSSGIGAATALEFAKYGARVIIASRTIDEAHLDAINQAGGEAAYIKADMLKTQDIKNLFAEIEKRYGQLDFAFNNAGNIGHPRKKTHELDEDIWERVIQLNLTAVWQCMKHELAMMVKQNHGVIVNMSSIAGLMGNGAVDCAYFASKHGVVGLTKKAAAEYARNNIRVNAVCPGFIETPLVSDGMKERGDIHQILQTHYPMGRMGKSEEVAQVVTWLCSNASSYITGVALPVDGGRLA